MQLVESGRDFVERPKTARDKPERALRALLSVCDPRAWLHLLRIINYYNHTHVAPRRILSYGTGTAISPTASFANAHNISLGRGCHIGTHCYLWAGEIRGKIVVGDSLLLGPNVMITAASYRFNSGGPVTKQPMKEKDIIIGNDIWIGAGAVVLPGAVIGDGAIIGAGSVIRGEVAPYSVIASNAPGEIAKRRQI